MIILLIASTLILASGIFSIVHSFLFDLDNKSQYLLILYQILIMIATIVITILYTLYKLIFIRFCCNASKLLQST